MKHRSILVGGGILIVLMMCQASVIAGLINNGDGTILDDCFGLEWKQESKDEPMDWNSAHSWAAELVFAGHDDWRLPSAIRFNRTYPDINPNSKENEWGHLYGYEWGNPTSPAGIAPMIGFTCDWYWTDTKDPLDPSVAYAFRVSYDGYWFLQAFPIGYAFCAAAVRGAGPIPPVPIIFEDPHNPLTGETVTFDPSQSYDPDGVIVNYEWDFDGDGTYDTNTSTPAVVTHVYGFAGFYTVTLRVTDNDGIPSIVVDGKNVRDGVPPIPCFNESAHEIEEGGTITFDPSCSRDPDGEIETYEWDFDGDGVVDETTDSPQTVTHTYDEAGTYQVSLTVTDDDGNSVTMVIMKTVKGTPAGGFDIGWLIPALVLILYIILVPVTYMTFRGPRP